MENIIDDILLALALLKKKEILITLTGDKKTYVVLRKDKIYFQNDACSFKISIDEFKELYKSAKFIVYEPDNNSYVDLEKDKEYYSYDVLKY